MKHQSLTIHKKNELVRGADDYSIFAKRALNAIYYFIQKENLYTYETITIPFTLMRKFLNLQKEQNYVDIMRSALLELKKPIELYHFIHPKTHKEYEWYATSFLNDVAFYKQDQKWYVQIEVSKLILYLMQQKGNFTKLDLLIYQNRVRTKYSMKLYEFLKSFQDYKEVSFSHEHILRLFKLQESKTYKYFANLKRLVERQTKEIQKKTDLSYLQLEVDKKKKTFLFKLDPRAKQEAPSEQVKEANLEQLLKRNFLKF